MDPIALYQSRPSSFNAQTLFSFRLETMGQPKQPNVAEDEANSNAHNIDGFLAVDEEAERSYVRKLDFYLLPFLSLCYFFSAVDRVRKGTHARSKTLISS